MNLSVAWRLKGLFQSYLKKKNREKENEKLWDRADAGAQVFL